MRDLLDIIGDLAGCSATLVVLLAIFFITVKAILIVFSWIF